MSRWSLSAGLLTSAIGVVVALLLTCGGESPSPSRVPARAPLSAGRVIDPQHLAEVEARLLIEQQLRDLGLRLLVDVPVRVAGHEMTLDGFDPDRKLGYEYLAPDEPHGNLTPGVHRSAFGRILVLAPAPARTLRQQVMDFLSDQGRD